MRARLLFRSWARQQGAQGTPQREYPCTSRECGHVVTGTGTSSRVRARLTHAATAGGRQARRFSVGAASVRARTPCSRLRASARMSRAVGAPCAPPCDVRHARRACHGLVDDGCVCARSLITSPITCHGGRPKRSRPEHGYDFQKPAAPARCKLHMATITKLKLLMHRLVVTRTRPHRRLPRPSALRHCCRSCL